MVCTQNEGVPQSGLDKGAELQFKTLGQRVIQVQTKRISGFLKRGNRPREGQLDQLTRAEPMEWALGTMRSNLGTGPIRGSGTA